MDLDAVNQDILNGINDHGLPWELLEAPAASTALQIETNSKQAVTPTKPLKKSIINNRKNNKIFKSKNNHLLGVKHEVEVGHLQPKTSTDTSQRATDDGFRIVSEFDLPKDDSDVSDAFESDLDEDVPFDCKSVYEKETTTLKKELSINRKMGLPASCVAQGVAKLSRADKQPLKEDDVQGKKEKRKRGIKNKLKNLPILGQQEETLVNIKQNKKLKLDQDTSESTACNETKEQHSHCKEKEDETAAKKDEADIKKFASTASNKKRVSIDSNENKDKLEKAASDESASVASKRRRRALKKLRKKEQRDGVNSVRPPLSKEEEAIVRARFSLKAQKIIDDLGLHWADMESQADRDSRALAKLPQPEQISGCRVYLMKDKASEKVLTVYDYSKKPLPLGAGPCPTPLRSAHPAPCTLHKGKAAPSNKSNAAPSISEVPLTKAQKKAQELRDKEAEKIKQQMAFEHKEELKAIKRKIVAYNDKVLDQDSKEKKMLALVEKLGGAKDKKPYVNYKVLLAQKKQEKLDLEAKQQELKNFGMHDLLKKKQRVRKRRDANDVSGFDSLGGRYKGGIMVLGKNEMSRLRDA